MDDKTVTIIATIEHDGEKFGIGYEIPGGEALNDARWNSLAFSIKQTIAHIRGDYGEYERMKFLETARLASREPT